MTPRWHDAKVRDRVRSWIAARRSDPVPVLLTSGGCIISAAALIFGVKFDARGVASNVIADLILVGPALFLSNTIVKRIQDARVRERMAPLLDVIAQFLYGAVATANHALEMLGAEAKLDLPSGSDGQVSLANVESTLARTLTQLDAATQGRELPASLTISQPLSFPRFGVIRGLVQQADQSYPMPWAIAAANIAEDWADRCGVDFFYPRPDGTYDRQRLVGLAQIEEQSKGAAAAAGLATESYLQTVRGCLYCAHGVARRLSEEAPTRPPHALQPNMIDIAKTVPS